MERMPAGLDGNPNPISSATRRTVIKHTADALVKRKRADEPLLVAIDGIDGSGKSTFADELAAQLGDQNINTVRSTIDSFHNRRDVRRSKGKSSPAGFYLDSHNLSALKELLLDPMAAGRGAMYRTACFDEPTDQPVDGPEQPVSGDEILIFDGIFLCRPELIDYWDYTVFLEAQARVDLQRLGYVTEDAPPGGLELIDHVLTWVSRIDRYSSGMRFYLDSETPKVHADIVIDNNNLAEPVIVDRQLRER